MSVIVWGKGVDVVRLGHVTDMTCEGCGEVRPFELVMTYRYWGVYWIFNVVLSRRYHLVCPGCQGTFALDKTKVESTLLERPVPIPFMRQYGLSALTAAVGLLWWVLGSLVLH